MSVEFTLEHLTPRQMALADIIWACENQVNVDRFIQALPTRGLRTEARTIVDLMVMAVVEQCYDGITPMAAAEKILNKIRNKA
jgi:hypothetical protein